MLRYPALIDSEDGTYGVTFPDLPGVVAMAETLDQALVNAEDALRDYAIETEKDGRARIFPSAIGDMTPGGEHARVHSADPSFRSQHPRQHDA